MLILFILFILKCAWWAICRLHMGTMLKSITIKINLTKYVQKTLFEMFSYYKIKLKIVIKQSCFYID